MTVSGLLEQPATSTIISTKLLTACSKLVDNLGQAVRTQLVDGLLVDLLQDASTEKTRGAGNALFTCE